MTTQTKTLISIAISKCQFVDMNLSESGEEKQIEKGLKSRD